MFAWSYGLLQWNLMARSSNIDALCFHNVKRGVSDSLTFKFDSSKCDQTGEFVTEKNVYANPLNPELCPWLAFAVHIGLNAEHLEKSERIFVKPGSKCGAGLQRYCRQLAEMFKRHSEVVRRYVRLSHENVHGVRKVRTYVLKCIFLSLFIYMI